MQEAVFAFQAFQVLRFGSLMLGAMSLAWLGAPKTLIDTFETLLLVGGATTFFWLGGLLDGFLLLQKNANPLHGDAIQRQTMFAVLALSITSAVATGVAAMIFYPSLDLEKHVIPFCTYWAFETASQALPYHFIAYDRGRRLLEFGIFSSIGYFAIIAFATWCQWSFGGMMTGLSLLALMKAIWMLRSMYFLKQRGSSVPFLGWDLWRIAWPLMLAVLFGQSAVYVDGFLVQHYFPKAFVDFRYGAREFPLALLLANSMSIVSAGEIAAGMRKGDVEGPLTALRKRSNRLIWMLFPISIALMVLSGPLFDLFFAGRFPLAMPVFDIFLLLVIPRLMFPQAVVRGYHKTKWMSLSAGIELVLNICLSLLLMQWMGIAGIAMGTFLAYMVEKAFLLGYTQFKLGVHWSRYASIPIWLGWSLLSLAVWLAKYLMLTRS